jgi:hypothetical protein
MKAPPFDEIKDTIENRLEETNELLGELEYEYHEITAKQFYDYLTGDTFSEDKTTLRDVLGNEYLMVHEIVEITELLKLGVEIDKKTVMDTPREKVYKAHLNAIEFELEYSLLLEDYYWLKHRLNNYQNTLKEYNRFSQDLRERAEEIWDHYKEYMDY